MSGFGKTAVLSEAYSPMMLNSPKSGRGKRAGGGGMNSPVHLLPTLNGKSPKHRESPPPSF